MKKSKIFLKSLIGIPLGIFILETFNIIISIEHGEYIRLDGLANGINLNSVLLTYFYCSIYSYIAMIVTNYPLEVSKGELAISERKKQINKVIIPVIILFLTIFFISIFIKPDNYESIFGACSAMLCSFIAIVIGMVQDLLSKHSIKQINETLKTAFKE